jgi:hypothetical protein
MASIMSVARYWYNVHPPPSLKKLSHALATSYVKMKMNWIFFFIFFPKGPRGEREARTLLLRQVLSLSLASFGRGRGRKGGVIFVGTPCFVSVVFYSLPNKSFSCSTHHLFLMTYIDGGTTTLLLVWLVLW